MLEQAIGVMLEQAIGVMLEKAIGVMLKKAIGVMLKKAIDVLLFVEELVVFPAFQGTLGVVVVVTARLQQSFVV